MFTDHISHDGLTASLWTGDGLALLESLPDSSVDLILSSPPYCVGKEYDKFSSVAEFKAEILRISPQILRVLKDGGSLCWQVGHHVSNGSVCPLDAVIYSIYEEVSTLKLRNRIIWHFGHGVHAKLRFSGRHETIMWYSKGPDVNFDLDAVRIAQRYPGKRHYKGPNKGQLSGNPLGKNPGDVWDIPNVKARHVEKTEHPCQFPVALAKRLVDALSPKGGLVVDPYAGSGSSGVAALLAGRNFLGSDLEERYVKIARERLISTADKSVVIRADVPTRLPNPREAVARRPEHFVC